MATKLEIKAGKFLTLSGKVQKVNRAAVERSDFATFRNIGRYNAATQAALVGVIGSALAGKPTNESKPNYVIGADGNLYIVLKGGMTILVRRFPKLPDDTRVWTVNEYTDRLIATSEGRIAIEHSFGNSRVSEIVLRETGREVMNLLVVAPLPIK